MRADAARMACWVLLASLTSVSMPCRAFAQGTSGPIVTDSRVGYIDNAIPGDVLRFRYDAAYNNRRPNRAEFFYAQGAPRGPGLPLPERSVDVQDLSAYAEIAFLPQLSAFLDVPVRFLNPETNDNAAGLSDVNLGVKYAFLQTDTGTWSLQLRTWAPTGEGDRGLGTRHASVEPGLLFFQTLGPRTAAAGELRYWQPLGGTDFAGPLVRYGLGLQVEAYRDGERSLTPVAEFVGFTALGGKESIVHPSGDVQVQEVAGQTVVQSKLGVRVGLSDRFDLYGGWGRPLTGTRWYENTLRLEVRWMY